jgi:hypothetical protein
VAASITSLVVIVRAYPLAIATALRSAATIRPQEQEDRVVEPSQSQYGVALSRNVGMEARALRLQRSAAYRRGDALAPDTDFVDAILEVKPYLGALVGLTEAAIAWRTQAYPLAQEQSLRSAAVWRDTRSEEPALLAEALAYAAGSRVHDAGALLEAAADSSCAPRIAVQLIGLIASADETLRARCRALIETLAPSVRDDPALCLDLISLAEARAFAQEASLP